MIYKFGTEKSINTDSETKKNPNTTRILNFKYLFIDFAAPN